MATPAQPLAVCILRWIYSQLAEVLKMLKNFLLGIIAFIDAQIAILQAWVAQWGLVALANKYIFDQIQKILDQIREQMTSIPGGPAAELCPEFYSYFLGPALYLFDTAVASLNRFKERFLNMISFENKLNQLIAYWEQTKANLIMAIDILDDAIYKAAMDAAAQVP